MSTLRTWYETDDLIIIEGVANCTEAEQAARQLVPHRKVRMVSLFIERQFRVHLVPESA